MNPVQNTQQQDTQQPSDPYYGNPFCTREVRREATESEEAMISREITRLYPRFHAAEDRVQVMDVFTVRCPRSWMTLYYALVQVGSVVKIVLGYYAAHDFISDQHPQHREYGLVGPLEEGDQNDQETYLLPAHYLTRLTPHPPLSADAQQRFETAVRGIAQRHQSITVLAGLSSRERGPRLTQARSDIETFKAQRDEADPIWRARAFRLEAARRLASRRAA